MNHIRVLALLAVALIATSCSRSLPTAPSAPVVKSVQADAYATAGLENQVVVTLAPGVRPSDLAAQFGAAVVRNFDNVTVAFRPIAGQTAATLLVQMTADGRCAGCEMDSWLEPAESRQQSFAFDDGFGNDKTFAEQPAAGILELDRAHDVATGRGVKVAILDTGADLHHPMLQRHMVPGWDFVDNDADPTDRRDFVDNDRDGSVDEAFGHGTHVAGIVHLVAPQAQLLIVRVLDADGRGDIVNIAAGVRWAVAQGAKVINLSLGTTRNVDALQHALEDAENAGVIVVSSAGNDGFDVVTKRNTVEFPGKSSHAFGIAAVDGSGIPALFSSAGNSDVMLSAPGVGIRSTYPGGGYKLWSGTSMSTPFVAGAAALLAEKHPLWTMDDVSARLESTARVFPGTVTQPKQYGAGILNVGRALAPDFVPAPDQPPPPPEDIRPR